MADPAVIALLKKGDMLCSSKSTPMKVKIIKQVREIYLECEAILGREQRKDTPLILATRLGLAHMVWGFIECTTPRVTERHIPSRWSLEKKNWYGDTALHVAGATGNVDAVQMLLSNISLEQLISTRNQEGKTPLSVLSNPRYDEDIFACLERTTSTPHPTITPHSTPNQATTTDGEEFKKHYIDEEMDPSMHPRSHLFFSSESLQKLTDGVRELGPNNDTILHLYVKIGNMPVSKTIMETHSSLMYYCNSDGEVPAFVAAREGQLDILKMMIDYFRSKNDDILRLMTSRKGKQSALHVAVKNHHAGVVFWLLKEVQGLVHHVNEYGVTPLYVAAEEGHVAILKLIMKKCEIKSFSEQKGGTALHAAAAKGSVECIEYLLSLKTKEYLLFERDDKHMNPLDVAVLCGHMSAAKILLDCDYSLGYLRLHTMDGDVSTVHIAARADRCEILEDLISKCPGCVDITNGEGRNILHVAIQHSSMKVIEFIFGNDSLTTLINQKDNDRNTPIHLLVDKASNNSKDFNLDITTILQNPLVDHTAVNNKSHTPIQMASSDEERLRLEQVISQAGSKWKVNVAYLSEEAQIQIKMMDQVVIVAALIATASFAAAFAVPGGFDGNEGSQQGMPVLIKELAYKAFVVANALAFSCSCSVLFENVKLLINRYARDQVYKDDLNRILGSVFAMHILTGVAMLAMMTAFITGTYAVLKPNLGFVIPICSACVLIFVGTLFLAAKIGVSANRYFYPAT